MDQRLKMEVSNVRKSKEFVDGFLGKLLLNSLKKIKVAAMMKAVMIKRKINKASMTLTVNTSSKMISIKDIHHQL